MGSKISKKTYKGIIAVFIALLLTAVVIIGGIGTGIVIYNSPSNKEARLLKRAETYITELEYDLAIAEYEKILIINPKSEEAYIGLADTYSKMSDTEKELYYCLEGYSATGVMKFKERAIVLKTADIEYVGSENGVEEIEKQSETEGNVEDVTMADKISMISKEMAYGAIRQDYNMFTNSGNELDYLSCYWNISEETDNEVVVLWHSYTGSSTYYHINKQTGDVYLTEFVPGITEEEVLSEETYENLFVSGKVARDMSGMIKGEIYNGSHVYFGEYEQDNNIENGKEPIEWTVLYAKNGEALLWSTKVLDYQQYEKDEENILCSWEECTLRQWLNEEFYNSAFGDELKPIVINHSVNNKYYDFENKEDSIVYDNVFLLDYTELKCAFGYSGDWYDCVCSDSLRTEATEYCKVQTEKIEPYLRGYGYVDLLSENETESHFNYEYQDRPYEDHGATYLLRAPGGYETVETANCCILNPNCTEDHNYGEYICWKDYYYGVRPAIWVKYEY